MTKATAWTWLGAAICASALLASGAHAQDVSMAGPSVNITGTGDKVQAAGATVTVSGSTATVEVAGATVDLGVTATGDVKIAAAQATFAGSVAGDLDVVGAAVDVKGTVQGDVRVGGAVVDINLKTGGSLSGGGARFTLSPLTDIAGDLQGGAALMIVNGHIAGKVNIGGARVVFNARADGPVDITADTIVIGPDAILGGTLTIRSPNDPQIDPAATLASPPERAEAKQWMPAAPWMWPLVFGVAIAIGTIVAGFVLLLFGGRVFATSVGHVRHKPLSSFLFGILTVILVPFIAVVLMVTVVGISAGLAILFIMPFLLVFGHAVAATGIASGLMLRRPGEVGALLLFLMLVVGAVVLTALGFIPIVGPLIVLIAILLGVGAFTRTIGHRVRHAEQPPASGG